MVYKSCLGAGGGCASSPFVFLGGLIQNLDHLVFKHDSNNPMTPFSFLKNELSIHVPGMLLRFLKLFILSMVMFSLLLYLNNFCDHVLATLLYY
jgi:hypothetical protein